MLFRSARARAAALDADHPQALVGLARLLLAQDAPAARSRATGLLEKLVASPRGWELPDAWLLLADALERSGEVERARGAYWRVVELEDGTGVRAWGCCSGVV